MECSGNVNSKRSVNIAIVAKARGIIVVPVEYEKKVERIACKKTTVIP